MLEERAFVRATYARDNVYRAAIGRTTLYGEGRREGGKREGGC